MKFRFYEYNYISGWIERIEVYTENDTKLMKTGFNVNYSIK